MNRESITEIKRYSHANKYKAIEIRVSVWYKSTFMLLLFSFLLFSSQFFCFFLSISANTILLFIIGSSIETAHTQHCRLHNGVHTVSVFVFVIRCSYFYFLLSVSLKVLVSGYRFICIT